MALADSRYFIFLLAAWPAVKRIRNPLPYYIGFGLLGLSVEIFILGQLPAIIGSGIIGLASWITFWGSVALLPRLYITVS